jgi:catechol 2,3-dioxygenase-like lactoylglutathione lyase family enzyme
VDTRLEVAMIPVSDVGKAKQFYQGLGWRVDADIPLGDDARVVQLTPPGSACSVSFGKGVSPGMELVVEDIDAARADLAKHGVEVSEPFHREAGKLAPGADPNHTSYNSYASFKDPDGNGWLLQEVTSRLPGRTTSPLAIYGSEAGLADALRRAAAAHGRHEAEIGKADENWPDWYAHFMAAEAGD